MGRGTRRRGSDPSLISFSAQSKNNWHAILTEAEKVGKIDGLLDVALSEYGSNENLRITVELYRAEAEKEQPVSAPQKSLAEGKPPEKPPPVANQVPQNEAVPAFGSQLLPGEDSNIPEWFSYAGVVFGALTLLFFMGLVILSLFDYEVPESSKFIVIVVLALGSALSTSFLGGWAAAKGQIPIPFFQEHPMQFSAGGGIAVLLIVMLLGYWIYVRPTDNGPNTTPAPGSLASPNVYLMDSKELEMIYHPEEPGTNTKHIRDILSWFPINPPTEELLYYEWGDGEIIRQEEPDLIVIHALAFYTTTNTADPAKKLDSFLRTMEGTDTKFLIYSRDENFEDEEEAKGYFEGNYPYLAGRVEVLYVPKTDYCSYWKCSETQQELQRKVRSLLGLP